MPSSPDRIETLATEVAELRRQLAGLQAAKARRNRWLIAGALLVGGTAFASTLTDGLYVFAPNTPALASEINANFNQLRTWMRNKVGMDLNSADIVGPGNISAAGAMSAASWSGPLNAAGNVSVGANGTTLSVTGSVSMMGASAALTYGQVYLAGTDGFVFATLQTQSNCDQGPAYIQGFAGPTSGSLALRGEDSVHGGCINVDYATPYGSFMMPVRKGEYYSVGIMGNGGTYNYAASFIPFGK
jgi:hypothetical protein